MKTWIKLTKYYQGGYLEDYKYIDSFEIETKEQQQHLMKEWGEGTDGGHSYGYRVNLIVLRGMPPKAWLKNEISKAEKNIKCIKEEKSLTKKQRIQKQKDIIETYKKLL
jgi:hypothetical protein